MSIEYISLIKPLYMLGIRLTISYIIPKDKIKIQNKAKYLDDIWKYEIKPEVERRWMEEQK